MFENPLDYYLVKLIIEFNVVCDAHRFTCFLLQNGFSFCLHISNQ